MKPIKTALAAYGLSGKIFHAPFLILHPAFELAAVLERSKSESAGLNPAPTIVRSFDDLLDDDSIDLLVINTPSGLHYDMAKQALQAGKHLVVEKPFTNTAAEARELIELAEQKDLMLTVYHNRRLESGYLTVQQILEQNLLGSITGFRTCVDRFRPALGHKVWKEQANPAAGLLYDFGSHLIDEALQLFGRPRSIYADLRCLREGASACDDFVIHLDYDNALGQFRAELRASMVARAPSAHYTLHGMAGSYQKAIGDLQESLLMAGKQPDQPQWCAEPEAEWGQLYLGESIESYPSQTGRYLDFYDNIAKVLCGEAELLVKPAQALEVIELLEWAQQSDRQGQRLSLAV